ncbi:hypothetical protein J6590_081504 [Homalodisca vitripennis]|nr:hypothetical protein J6590_081504 [Homalodisca vitripennis]
MRQVDDDDNAGDGDDTKSEVRAKKPSLTQPGDQRLKGDFRTTTNGRAGGPLARTGSLSGQLSKQRPRSTLLDLLHFTFQDIVWDLMQSATKPLKIASSIHYRRLDYQKALTRMVVIKAQRNDLGATLVTLTGEVHTTVRPIRTQRGLTCVYFVKVLYSPELTVYLAYMLCVHLARLVYTGGGRYSCPVPGKHPFLSPELATSSSSPYRFFKEKPIPFYALFCPSSWTTGLCDDLIEQNEGESQYSTRSMVLIKSARVKDGFEPARSNSDSKSNILDRSAIGTPISFCVLY